MHRTLLFFFSLVGFLYLSSCENEKAARTIEITQTIPIERFELAFADTSIPLKTLKSSYPYLFPTQTADSIWIKKRNDQLEIQLIRAIDSVFKDMKPQQEELNKLFSYYHYYFPNATIPKGISLSTNIDYFSRVIYADSLLLMGLDNFLGSEHPFYQNFPSYLKQTMSPQHLVHSIAEQLALSKLPKNKETTFLSKIIYEGKLLYLQQRLVPDKSLANRLGYTEQQLKWAQLNEAEIWRYFIDRELLYSTDRELEFRFITPAPFSKFKLALDKESPGRIGRFIGYRIVSSYMNNNNSSLDLLLGESAVNILKKATYKPLKQ
jgi:hypothetical protein